MSGPASNDGPDSSLPTLPPVSGWPTSPAILIVDDHEPNLRLFSATLRGVGADLYTARTGEEALALCAERSYAMILLDVHLAGMSGFEVALRLRESGQSQATPIVFVSAVYTHESNAFRAYKLGAVDYILSPVVPQILRAKAQVFIRMDRMRREAEQQARSLEKAYRELRSAHTELEHFSWSVSHDLRTPLSQVQGFATLLQMRASQLDETGREQLQHVLAASERMSALIDDMLELSRITRGEFRSGPVDLSALVQDIAFELAENSPAGAVRPVKWRVEPDVQALGDARMLRLAMTNLLGNAWKYSARREQPHIEFGRVASDGESIYFVRDNGAGFDAEAAGDRLFRPFQRFHTDTQFEGTGIGLAIVQRVVVKHGGQIWAESSPGQGASFFFTLPPLPRAMAETEDG